jgi:uncharacterized repeat protein (TIGR01451 family)
LAKSGSSSSDYDNDEERPKKRRRSTYQRRSTSRRRSPNRDNDDDSEENEIEDNDQEQDSDNEEERPKKRRRSAYQRRSTSRRRSSSRDNEDDSDRYRLRDQRSSDSQDEDKENEQSSSRSRSSRSSSTSSGNRSSSGRYSSENSSKRSSSSQNSNTSKSSQSSSGNSSSSDSSTSNRSKSSRSTSRYSSRSQSGSERRSYSKRSRFGFRIFSRRRRTREQIRLERSQRTRIVNAWRGEWLQIKRVMWRMNRYLENRYYSDNNSNDHQEADSRVRLYQDDQKTQVYGSRTSRENQTGRRKAIAVSSGRTSGRNSDNAIWKLAATTGTIGLALLLLLNLMPTQAKQVPLPIASVDVIDTRTTLRESKPKSEDDLIHYEIVLLDSFEFPEVAFLPEKPDPEIEKELAIIPEFAPDSVIEIVESDPFELIEEEPELQLDLLRIPLTKEFAKYFDPPEETELFVVTSQFNSETEGITNSEYDQIEGNPVIKNQPAEYINDNNWNQYTAVTNRDYNEVQSYEGQEIPESLIRSEDHVPRRYRNSKSISDLDHSINIEIEKKYPQYQALGETQEYIILLKNLSNQTIDEINVSEFIPDGMQVIHVEPAASFEDNELSWKFIDVKAGSVQKIQIQVKMEKKGLVQSVAYVQPVVAVASESVVQTFRPRLQLTMLMPNAVPTGERYPVRYRVTNLSKEDVDDLVLLTDLPEEIDHRHGRKLKYDIGTLKAGENREITLQAVAETPGQGIQTASLKSSYGDSSSVRKNVQVIASSRRTRHRIRQASPVEDCCCWKISFLP